MKRQQLLLELLLPYGSEVTAGRLSTDSKINSVQLNSALLGMLKEGLVTRRRHPTLRDRSFHFWKMTPKGLRLREALTSQ